MRLEIELGLDELADLVRHLQNRRLPLTALGPVSEQPDIPGPTTEFHMLAVLGDSQQGVVTYGPPLDKRNKIAQIQNLAFMTSDATVAKFVAGVPDAAGNIVPDPAGDGMIRGTIVAGNPAVCQVWIEGDSDLGDGVSIIRGEKVDVQVTGGSAVGFGAPTFGTATEQP